MSLITLILEHMLPLLANFNITKALFRPFLQICCIHGNSWEQKSKLQSKPIEGEKSEDISGYKAQDWKPIFQIITTNIHKLGTSGYKINEKLTTAACNSFAMLTTSSMSLNKAC